MAQVEKKSLYRVCVASVAENIKLFRGDLKNFPAQQVCDVYKQLCKNNNAESLQWQLDDFSHFLRILKSTASNWETLFQCVQRILVHKPAFGRLLAKQATSQLCTNKNCILAKIKDCLLLGIFFMECGMYQSAKIALSCAKIFQKGASNDINIISIELWTRLVHVYTADCKFPEAKFTLNVVEGMIQQFSGYNQKHFFMRSLFYTGKSSYLFALSRYAEAYETALVATAALSPNLPYKVIVDSLRQTAKTSIIKRLFKQAGVLIRNATLITKQIVGQNHPKYAECLVDYGFFLLNVDAVAASVKAYQSALDIRQSIFGPDNLLTAGSHEDLAYALYVRDYSTGNFDKAREHAEAAISTFTNVLEPDHLLLASSKRVKALILEEVALDSTDDVKRVELLNEAEELHLESLKLARNSFGESNVQTAKHYGNLGRLYQSMKRFKEAEQMHLRAIEIKENLLGKEDYEVALSLGHLASLYNYDMAEYQKAEELYLKSIRIGCRLFGDCYSGLEYDYRGLINLYAHTGNYTEMARYHLVLADWQELRKNANKPDFIMSCDDTSEQPSIANLIKTFQDMINADVIR